MRFELKEWNEAHAPSLTESAADARIPQYLRNSFPHPYTRGDADAFIAFAAAEGKRGDLYRAIVAEEKAVGGIAVTRGQDVYCRSAEIGYWLSPAYWGWGIMTEAVRRICKEAFENTDIVRICAEVFSPNAASLRVLEKCGFVREGIKRKSVFKNGTFYDGVVCALLRPEKELI